MPVPHHPFIELDSTDRADWVAAFCARRASAPPASEPPFPALIAGQSPYDWLVRQFQLLAHTPGLRQRLRETVKELVTTTAGRVERRDRDQVLGMVLCVARELEFAEIATDLVHWVRSGWLDEGHVYRLGSEVVPLRRTVWLLLIRWNHLDGLEPQLTRDLVRMAESNEEGTAQICFDALGQRNPDEALRVIPATAGWDEAYWMRAVTKFFTTVGPVELLKEKHEPAWKSCLGRCFYDRALDPYMRERHLPQWAEFDVNRKNRLWEALFRAGITVEQYPSSVLLKGPEGSRLKVDVSDYTAPIESSAIPNNTLSSGATLAEVGFP